jgi:hypothetical protein
MRNIIYNVIVSLLSGIGIFFVVSGIGQKTDSNYGTSSTAFWQFDPLLIGIGTAFIVGTVLLYKNTRSK